MSAAAQFKVNMIAPSSERDLAARAADLLADLQGAHEKLLEAIAEMDSVTSEARPDRSLYPHARWKLSRASRIRRGLVSMICSELLKSANSQTAGMIEALEADGNRLLRESVSHVGTWTMESIEANWSDYRKASAGVRESMRVRIALEREILYPLLRKCEASLQMKQMSGAGLEASGIGREASRVAGQA